MRWWSPWYAKVAILLGALQAIAAVLDLAGVAAVSDRKIIEGPPNTLQTQVRGLQTNADKLVAESKRDAAAAAADELRLAGLR